MRGVRADLLAVRVAVNVPVPLAVVLPRGAAVASPKFADDVECLDDDALPRSQIVVLVVEGHGRRRRAGQVEGALDRLASIDALGRTRDDVRQLMPMSPPLWPLPVSPPPSIQFPAKFTVPLLFV